MTYEEIMLMTKPRRARKKPDISTMVCNDNHTCFARKRAYDGVGPLICTILATSYSVPGECPFRKPEREVTNGKHYPYKEELWDHNLRRTLRNKEAQKYAEN